MKKLLWFAAAATILLGRPSAQAQESAKTVHLLFSSSSHGYFDPCG